MVPFLTCNKSITVHRLEFVEFSSVNDSCDYLEIKRGQRKRRNAIVATGPGVANGA